MKISDCMKRKVISARPETLVKDGAQIMVKNHIGTLPIVDENSRLIGLVRMRDLITLALPDFVRLLDDVDFVHNFGAVEHHIPERESLNMPLRNIMGEPIAVDEAAGLLRAVAILQEHKMNDLPVIDADHRLVGIASYVDIGVALMSNWNPPA